MSIQTSAKPEATKIREIIESRGSDSVSTKKQTEQTEIELSIPALIIIILAIAAVIYGLVYLLSPKSTGGDTTKKQPQTIEESVTSISNVSLSDVAFKGNAKAKYAFIVLSDPECPACQYYAQGDSTAPSTEKQIVSRYVDTGIVKYGFVPYIAVSSHKPAATEETVAARCADQQGKLFEYLDETFKETLTSGAGIKGLRGSRDSLLNVAKTVNVSDISKFTSCLDTHDIVKIDELQQKYADEIMKPWVAEKGNFFGTPAFFVCKISDDLKSCTGTAYVGSFPFDSMKSVIDQFLGADAPKN